MIAASSTTLCIHSYHGPAGPGVQIILEVFVHTTEKHAYLRDARAEVMMLAVLPYCCPTINTISTNITPTSRGVCEEIWLEPFFGWVPWWSGSCFCRNPNPRKFWESSYSHRGKKLPKGRFFSF